MKRLEGPAERSRRTRAAALAIVAAIAAVLGVFVLRRGHDAARPRPSPASTVGAASREPSSPRFDPAQPRSPEVLEVDAGPEIIPPDPRGREEKVTNEPLYPKAVEAIPEPDRNTFPPERREKITSEPLHPKAAEPIPEPDRSTFPPERREKITNEPLYPPSVPRDAPSPPPSKRERGR